MVKTLEATIKNLQGEVEVRFPDRIDWETAKAGMKLPEGTDLRTGPFSSADLVFEDNSVAFLESFSRLTIDEFFQNQSAVVTRLSLKVGNIVSHVRHDKQERLANDYKVTTPTLVVSVRGTEIKSVSAGALYGDRVEMGSVGKIAITDPQGRRVLATPKEVTDTNLTPSHDIVKKESVVIHPPAGSTDNELKVAAKMTVTKASTQGSDLGIRKDPIGETTRGKHEAPVSPTISSEKRASLGLEGEPGSGGGKGTGKGKGQEQGKGKN